MRSKGCLIALAAVLAAAAGLAGLFGPALVREGRRFYVPISKMKAAQDELQKWTREHPWREPATPELSAETLERFLSLRRELRKLEQSVEIPPPGLPEEEKPKLKDVPQIIEGVGGVVAGEMGAYMRSGMPPKQYAYLERLVYRKWLGALRSRGADPAALERAAEEIEKAALAERDESAAARLRQVARDVRAKHPQAPEGVPAEVHALLIEHAQEIESLAEIAGPLPLPRERRIGGSGR